MVGLLRKYCFSIFFLIAAGICSAISLPTSIDEAKQKYPEIFFRGFHQLSIDGESLYVSCGLGIRYFDDESIEPTEDLWHEAELDAKEHILDFFRKQRKKDVSVTIKGLAPLFHWKEGKRSYFRNFVVRKENLTVLEPAPAKPAPSPAAVSVPETVKADAGKPAEETAKTDADKTAKEEFEKKLAAAKTLYFSCKYCDSFKAFNELPKGITALPQDDRSLAERAKHLCEVEKDVNIPKAYEVLGDVFFGEKDFTKSFFYYREYTNWMFEKERWLKNVPETILFRCGFSAYKLGLKSQARELLMELDRYYPFGEQAAAGRKLLEEIKNE